MVVSCWVKGCVNRADGLTKRGFFSIPAIREKEGDFTKQLTDDRRRQWLANINRKDAPSKYSRICSDHFVNGTYILLKCLNIKQCYSTLLNLFVPCT